MSMFNDNDALGFFGQFDDDERPILDYPNLLDDLTEQSNTALGYTHEATYQTTNDLHGQPNGFAMQSPLAQQHYTLSTSYTAAGSFVDEAFPNLEGSQFGDMLSQTQRGTINTQDLASPLTDEIVVSPQDLITDVHAAPYAAGMQIPGRNNGGVRQFYPPLPHSYGADSGYVTRAPMSEVSYVSAPPRPRSMGGLPDDRSEISMARSHRSRKTFHCSMPGNHRTRDFANIHDLERHQLSKHGIMPTHGPAFYFCCQADDCNKAGKKWDRKDNFRSHLQRKHFQGRNDEMAKKQIDAMVSACQHALSHEQMELNHQEKLLNKQSVGRRRSQRSDQHRVQKKQLSRHNSTTTKPVAIAGRHRGPSISISCAPSVAPSIVDCVDEDQQSNYMFDHGLIDDLTLTSPNLSPTLGPTLSPTLSPLSPTVTRRHRADSLQVPPHWGYGSRESLQPTTLDPDNDMM